MAGYAASKFDDGDSEFDIVFSADGHRYIGEVEGRDNKSIAIEKFSQLERNIQEDFAKETSDEYAIGVLFGNAYRLEEVKKRKDCFTEKVITAAKRTGARLISTTDLFRIIQHYRKTQDADFATACRAAIFEQAGAIVQFPSTPPPTKLEIRAQDNDVESEG